MSNSVTLTAGQSYNLTTRCVERPRTAPGPMDRPVLRSLSGNDLRALHAVIRRTAPRFYGPATPARTVFCRSHAGVHREGLQCRYTVEVDAS